MECICEKCEVYQQIKDGLVYCCLRQVRSIVDSSIKLEECINSPKKKYTKDEAKELLQSCGILDKDGNIKEAYKEIIVKNE